jgi:hypothetical protein
MNNITSKTIVTMTIIKANGKIKNLGIASGGTITQKILFWIKVKINNICALTERLFKKGRLINK